MLLVLEEPKIIFQKDFSTKDDSILSKALVISALTSEYRMSASEKWARMQPAAKIKVGDHSVSP